MFEALFDFSDWGWRTVVVWVVVLLVVYVLALLLRMMRLPDKASRPADAPSFEEIRQSRLQPYLDEAASATASARQGVTFVPESTDLAWHEPPQRFAEQQVQAALEREVNALREEVDGLREAFSALREDMLKELAVLRSQQGVAAFYREAMSLAASGKTAEDIAAQCGIARAEADLVISLAQARRLRDDKDREAYG